MKKATATSLVICLPCASSVGSNTASHNPVMAPTGPNSRPAQTEISSARATANTMLPARTARRAVSLASSASRSQPLATQPRAFITRTGMRWPRGDTPGPLVRNRKP
jgi:hypothetical protein